MNELERVVASPSGRRCGKTAIAAAILAAAAMGGAARPASGQVVVEYYHLDALGSIRVVTDQSVHDRPLRKQPRRGRGPTAEVHRQGARPRDGAGLLRS
jgi:hypothetical protein